jgi:hypothetical protein
VPSAAYVRRQRVASFVLGIVVATSSLFGEVVLAADPNEEVPSEEVAGDPSQRSDVASVVEREPVPLAFPADGGPAPATALDPSVDLRAVQSLDGLPADPTPASQTEIEAWRTEHSRSLLNPDGTITAEYSGARLNYVDAEGRWQPLDLTLLAKVSPAATSCLSLRTIERS